VAREYSFNDADRPRWGVEDDPGPRHGTIPSRPVPVKRRWLGRLPPLSSYRARTRWRTPGASCSVPACTNPS